MTLDSDIDTLLEQYPRQIATLANSARTIVRKMIPSAVETVDLSGGLIGFGVAPGFKGLVCTLLLSQRGVKLAITGGASIPDPEKLLEGTGKVHRYVVLHSAEDLEQPALRELIRFAVSRVQLASVGQRSGDG